MKTALVALILFFSTQIIFAQEDKCGANWFGMSPSQQQALMTPANACSYLQQANKNFQISLHISQDSLNNPVATTVAQVQDAIDELNLAFAPIAMSFSICFTEVMPDFHFYRWSQPDGDQQQAELYHYIPNTINLYCVNTIETDAGNVAGYAVFPGGSDIVVVQCEAGQINPNVLIHEMGHFFGLFHTFEEDNGLELSDGSNCETTGDLLCDTEADPEDAELVDGTCTLESPLTDSQGNYYTPPLDNYMSYYPDMCVCKFTLQQYNRMVDQYILTRQYLW